LVVNLPGSPKGATENLGAIVDLLPHILQLLEGDNRHH
jgi:molybdopterin biosynthesis enzyme MoaB